LPLDPAPAKPFTHFPGVTLVEIVHEGVELFHLLQTLLKSSEIAQSIGDSGEEQRKKKAILCSNGFGIPLEREETPFSFRVLKPCNNLERTNPWMLIRLTSL
jgi:hypothetical protein